MTTEFTSIPLSEKNILSFEDYLPMEVQHMILSPAAAGFGALERDVASGAVMVRTVSGGDGGDLLQLLWLSVDEDVLRKKVGTMLLADAVKLGREREAAAVYCRYPFEEFDAADTFFSENGFLIHEDAEDQDFHIAWQQLSEPEGSGEPFAGLEGASVMMPRLLGLLDYLEDMGYEEAYIAYDDTDRLAIRIPREDGKAGLMVAVLPEADNLYGEAYSILVKGSLSMDPGKQKGLSERLAKWQEEHVLVQAGIVTGEETVDFHAAVPVREGLLEEEEFRSFFDAVLREMDSFQS